MIIITGASRGIGKFLFNKFKEINENVVGTYNNTKPENDSELVKVDITKISDVNDFFANIKMDDSKICLVNCAGINYNSFAHKVKHEKWANVINTNLIGTFNMISNVLPIMREKNYGRIINFSSIVGQIGIQGTSAYAASKSGLWGMSKAIASENATKGITINNINLGYFNIGMIEEVPEEYQKVIKSKIPCKEFGEPEQIWNTIIYLINNDYLNGTEININGGMY